MTGMKMAKQMITIRPDIPVILCTGFSDQINEDQAHSAGIKALLLKPLLAREMSEAIRKTLMK
jgi:two-component system cell cycle sensor histidine kinase/response regulator CckA